MWSGVQVFSICVLRGAFSVFAQELTSIIHPSHCCAQTASPGQSGTLLQL